jgi:D-alanyl-D-alanine carboxypeptidase
LGGNLEGVTRLLALLVIVVALGAASASAAERPFYSTVRQLPAPLVADLTGRAWRPGCPVPLSELRLLTVAHWGFDREVRAGQLVVARQYADALRGVFRRLYDLRFPIRHMRLADMYGPERSQPADGDVTGSFECRQSVPSPCTGGTRSGRWSNHAYGLAIDLNPRENPYIGCGRTRDRASARYADRAKLRKGMVTPAVVEAFRSIGWGWGGDWTGQTKDYMHFSHNGR